MTTEKIPDCYCLDSKTKDIVTSLGKEAGLSPQQALNYIIEDWANHVSIDEALNPGLGSQLRDLPGKIRLADKFLDDLILKLKRASL